MVIAGPTAVGKTDVAIAVARHFKAPILSADARQFYRGLDIGTAKPTSAQLAAAEHYFIDHKDPRELYGAGHFERDAIDLLDRIYQTHDVAILAGGSGLYIKAVLEGVDDVPEGDAEIRAKIIASYKEKGLAWLQEEIRLRDPDYFASADRQNPQRLMRALEIIEASGSTVSSFRRQSPAKRNFSAVRIMLNVDRKELYRRIDIRVDEMISKGLIEEARRLYHLKDLNALNTVGYRELFAYFEGLTDLQTAVSKIKQHTRNYAKRQLTWLRNSGGYTELPPDSDSVIKYIGEVIHR